METSRHGNVPDWQTCSVICLSKSAADCGGWHYLSKTCTLFTQCTPADADNKDSITGGRRCHGKRK